jgi:hypothetical protein
MGHNNITVVWKAEKKFLRTCFLDYAFFADMCFADMFFADMCCLINGKIVAQKGISYAQGPGSDQSA